MVALVQLLRDLDTEQGVSDIGTGRHDEDLAKRSSLGFDTMKVNQKREHGRSAAPKLRVLAYACLS